jgi:hypothetical protein
MRAKSRVLTRELGQGRGPERRPVVTMGHGREVTAGQEGGGADPLRWMIIPSHLRIEGESENSSWASITP